MQIRTEFQWRALIIPSENDSLFRTCVTLGLYLLHSMWALNFCNSFNLLSLLFWDIFTHDVLEAGHAYIFPRKKKCRGVGFFFLRQIHSVIGPEGGSCSHSWLLLIWKQPHFCVHLMFLNPNAKLYHKLYILDLFVLESVSKKNFGLCNFCHGKWKLAKLWVVQFEGAGHISVVESKS